MFGQLIEGGIKYKTEHEFENNLHEMKIEDNDNIFLKKKKKKRKGPINNSLKLQQFIFLNKALNSNLTQ